MAASTPTPPSVRKVAEEVPNIPPNRIIRVERPKVPELKREVVTGDANDWRLFYRFNLRHLVDSWELWNTGKDRDGNAAVQDIRWAYREQPGDDYNTLEAPDRVGRTGAPEAIYVQRTDISKVTVLVLEVWRFSS